MEAFVFCIAHCFKNAYFSVTQKIQYLLAEKKSHCLYTYLSCVIAFIQENGNDLNAKLIHVNILWLYLNCYMINTVRLSDNSTQHYQRFNILNWQ